MREQLEHRLNVTDVGHVVDPAQPVGHERRREDGKSRVLVARRADGALERAAARDREGRRHGCGKLCGGLRRRQAFANVRDVNLSPVLALAGLAVVGLLAARLPRPRWRHLSGLDVLLAAGGPVVLLGLALGPGTGLAAPRRPAILTLGAIAAASGPAVVSLVARITGVGRRAARTAARWATLETAYAALLVTIPLALHRPRAPGSGSSPALDWLSAIVFTAGSGALA